MKELLKKTAERITGFFRALASGSGEKEENEPSANEAKLKNKNTGSSASKAGSAIRKAFGGIVKYRFAVSCAAVVILSAIVIGSVLGGRSAGATNNPVVTEVIASNNTPAPANTEAVSDDPSGFKDPHNVVAETFPPYETPEPYEPVTTVIPVITAIPVEIDDVLDAVYGEHNDAIPAVQERLMILWYMDQDEPTDYFGRITKGALEAFQRRNGLPVTGELDRTTYDLLFSNDAKVYLCELGDTGSDVQSVTDRLYELGYLDKATDVFDEATRDAVKDFQKANGLDADGRVGRNTKEALYNPECVPKAWTIGDSGDRILEYQKRLQQLGYLTTEPDGVYGKDTQMAVRRFQMQNQLVEDGYLGPTTREKLMSDDAVGNALSLSMQGSDVLNVQARLHALNYMRAQDVNGYFTSLTEQAVRLFQKNNNLQIDGKVGRNTMRVLMSDSAVRASSPVTPPSSNPSNPSNPGTNPGNGSSVQQKINRFISVARSKLGCRYVRGGKGPNEFDCSGFVYWCLNQSGVTQGYMTSLMWRSCTRYQRNNNINNVKKGDVIVYYGHVAICSGTWTMIDASSSKGKVVERSFNGNYWHRNFICSFRIFR